MSKLKSKLPGTNANAQDIDAFISGAETKSKPTPVTRARKKEISYPWLEPGVRDDVIKPYNLRLPEPYLLKLKFISENTPDSMQKFCISVILDAIDKKIEDLIK
jgi:hypothetical protein